MNDKVIIGWSFIIVFLISIIFIIGKKHENDKEITDIKSMLKEKVNLYLSDFDKYPKNGENIKVTSEELKTKNYIEEIIYEDKKCNATISVNNNNEKIDYFYDIDCYNDVK